MVQVCTVQYTILCTVKTGFEYTGELVYSIVHQPVCTYCTLYRKYTVHLGII